MNWKLILSLSVIGLGMAFATIYSIPPDIEPICWIAVFLCSTYFVASMAPGEFFLHGFIVCAIDCIFATCTQALLIETYLSRHPVQVDAYARLTAQTGLTAKQIILISRPAMGVLVGTIVGGLAVFASKYFPNREIIPTTENKEETEPGAYPVAYQSNADHQNNDYAAYTSMQTENDNQSLVYSIIVLVNPSEKQIEWVNEGRDNENAIIIPNVMNHPIKGLTFRGMHFDLMD